MINPTEAEEHHRLEAVQASLRDALDEIDARVSRYANDVQEQKNYSWEHRAEMDHVEKIATRQSIAQAVFTAEAALEKKKRIHKLLASPYFGRFDFLEQGQLQPLPVYVGIHAFYDEKLRTHLVYDWRAPIATLFYDFEIGPGRYESPNGEVTGEITLKRQYRIRHGRMELMLDTTLNIMDEVLQQELGRASDERMKNIVATIQREQNAIIRNEHAQVLIIQGVAGSGKTSIALHRIAYLLYKFKETLRSEDILILSPNRVFADYISNVLPELGEEQVAETEMERLAEELLEHQYKFETFLEQNERLLEKDDMDLKERIAAKTSLDFLRRIDAHVAQLEANSFVAEEWRVSRGRIVPDWFFAETWHKHRGVALAERIDRVVKATESQVGIHYNYDLRTDERRALREAVRAMMRRTTLREAYKGLFDWMGKPELFRPAKNSRLEWSDVFPLIYLKLRLEGTKRSYTEVKHLLIDEMQDYTPVQYTVISKLFSCKKTILGDANQAVNPFSASTAEGIRAIFFQAQCAELTKSYRSSYEITQFAQGISPNARLEAIERYGEAPAVLGFPSKPKELEKIRSLIREFADHEHNTLGIICRTQKQAAQMHKKLAGKSQPVHLLNAGSAVFTQGVIVCAAPIAKGLEFDQVIVPHASDDNYATDMDRNLLYVACTRAMHKLTLTFAGSLTRLIPGESGSGNELTPEEVCAAG
nr:AAA family ATPase [Gammaproteobacteria bacterium]